MPVYTWKYIKVCPSAAHDKLNASKFEAEDGAALLKHLDSAEEGLLSTLLLYLDTFGCSSFDMIQQESSVSFQSFPDEEIVRCSCLPRIHACTT